MSATQTKNPGKVEIREEECKGCGLCVDACPPACLVLADYLNPYGHHPAVFTDEDTCTACGICYYVCPEPGAITVYRTKEQKRETQAA